MTKCKDINPERAEPSCFSIGRPVVDAREGSADKDALCAGATVELDRSTHDAAPVQADPALRDAASPLDVAPLRQQIDKRQITQMKTWTWTWTSGRTG